MRKTALTLHLVLIGLEITALIHDIGAFGAGMFQYFTIDSNLLQLAVSALIAARLLNGRGDVPAWLNTLHLVCAVCLTVTFMIAAAVLAPQEGFAYYFLQDVAPINHFLAPVLSAVSFLLLSGSAPLPRPAAAAPAAATLLYGGIALALNAAGVLDGPYFFLRARTEQPGVIAMWFAIIAVLCLALGALYLWARARRVRRSAA